MPKEKIDWRTFNQDLKILVPGVKVRFTRRFGAPIVRGSYEAEWARQKRAFEVIFVEPGDKYLGGCMIEIRLGTFGIIGRYSGNYLEVVPIDKRTRAGRAKPDTSAEVAVL